MAGLVDSLRCSPERDFCMCGSGRISSRKAFSDHCFQYLCRDVLQSCKGKGKVSSQSQPGHVRISRVDVLQGKGSVL